MSDIVSGCFHHAEQNGYLTVSIGCVWGICGPGNQFTLDSIKALDISISNLLSSFRISTTIPSMQSALVKKIIINNNIAFCLYRSLFRHHYCAAYKFRSFTVFYFYSLPFFGKKFFENLFS